MTGRTHDWNLYYTVLMKFHAFLWAGLLTLLITGWWPGQTKAATNQALLLQLDHDENGGQLLSLHAEKVPFMEVLSAIQERTAIDIRVWQTIVEPVSLSLERIPVQQCMQKLCSNLATVFCVDPETGQYRIVGLDVLPAALHPSAMKTLRIDPPATRPQATSPPPAAPQALPNDDSAFPLQRASPPPASIPGELLIRFAPETPIQKQRSLHAFIGSRVLERLPSLNIVRVKLPDSLSEVEAIRLYLASGIVERAVKHALRYIQTTVPDDPKFSTQLMPQSIGLPRSWDLTQGAEEVIVAVIDTGMDTLHPDLQANIWINEQERLGEMGVDDDRNGYVDDITGYDFADDNGDVSDVDGHGTHVAGIIGARGNNTLGVSGVNWRVRIMPLKVQGDESGSILEVDVIEALEYALDQGASIINCSFGGEQFNELERDAFLRIQEAKGLAVCAAGNSGLNIDLAGNALYPASYDLQGIIAVAAGDSDATGQTILADFSNYGPTSVDLMAPGASILSTAISGQSTHASVQHPLQQIPAQGLFFAGTTDQEGRSGQLVDCGYAYEEEIPQAVARNIALIQRGGLQDDVLYFFEKLENVQHKGAVAAIIANNASGNFNGTLIHPYEWIPAVSISRADGNSLKALIGQEVRVINHPQPGSDRYTLLNGTSMAVAVVSGAFGLLQAWRPDMTPLNLKQPLLEAVDPVMNAQSWLNSGGRLNVAAALADLVLPGDLNLKGGLGLEDAVFGLELLTCVRGAVDRPRFFADVNKDGRIDVRDVQYVLRTVLEFKRHEQ